MTIDRQPRSKAVEQFVVRFNADGLRRELKVRAAMNERTLNSEILHLIKLGLAAEQQQPQGVAA